LNKLTFFFADGPTGTVTAVFSAVTTSLTRTLVLSTAVHRGMITKDSNEVLVTNIQQNTHFKCAFNINYF
jgi:hypothetical protein